MNISNRFVEWMSIYREGRYISTLNLELITHRTKLNRNSGIEPQRQVGTEYHGEICHEDGRAKGTQREG